jgi:hypothetical protein
VQDGSRARAKDCSTLLGIRDEAFVEAFLDQKFPLRGAFAARQDDRVHAFQVAGRAHKYVLDAHARERRCVRLEVTLYG